MEKRNVLITGSTSGIGLCIARAFAAKGYNILFNGIENEAAQTAAAVAAEFNIPHLFSPANLLQPASLREMVEQAVTHFGSVDILVNNAGIQHVSPIDQFPENKWDEIIAVNLTASFHLIKAVWPGMKNNRFGRIINIASAHGLVASEYKSAYVSSKHGLIGLTKAIALEGAPYNINCNAICPGYVKTAMVERQIQEQAKLHNISEEAVAETVFFAKQAVKEFIPVDAIADMALLLSESGSGTITGGSFPVDGGWSAQ
jgi:3-hydroxybutyrate dehydrogenase